VDGQIDILDGMDLPVRIQLADALALQQERPGRVDAFGRRTGLGDLGNATTHGG
jgi:hypothetical protein